MIEKTGNGYSAYIPDLPGCVAAGDTRAETEELIREAVVYHLELLRESGDLVPAPLVVFVAGCSNGARTDSRDTGPQAGR